MISFAANRTLFLCLVEKRDGKAGGGGAGVSGGSGMKEREIGGVGGRNLTWRVELWWPS